MTIPFVDLKAQYQTIKPDVHEAIAAILDGMQLFLGPNVRGLEGDFAAYSQAKYCIGVGSGTDAILLALKALGIGAGDEVITVSNTFFATIEAIVHAGATPVFIDIDETTYLMDPMLIESAITPKTKAIIPVHLYGQTADMDAIMKIAGDYGLKVIEDACQAHGAAYSGRRAGSLGDAAAFSCYFSKNLGGYGEGGLVTTNDESVAESVRTLRDHGSGKKYLHKKIGYNSRLDEIQAAVLWIKLKHLEGWNEARRAHAAAYTNALENVVTTPSVRNGNTHVFHLYVIRTPQRDQLQAVLTEKGIGTGIHYPVPCHKQAALAELGVSGASLPVTEKVVGEILSLPMYAELTGDQIQEVGAAIRSFV